MRKRVAGCHFLPYLSCERTQSQQSSQTGHTDTNKRVSVYVCVSEGDEEIFSLHVFFCTNKNSAFVSVADRWEESESVTNTRTRQTRPGRAFPGLGSLLAFRENFSNSLPINTLVSRLPLFSFPTSVYTKSFIIKAEQTGEPMVE